MRCSPWADPCPRSALGASPPPLPLQAPPAACSPGSLVSKCPVVPPPLSHGPARLEHPNVPPGTPLPIGWWAGAALPEGLQHRLCHGWGPSRCTGFLSARCAHTLPARGQTGGGPTRGLRKRRGEGNEGPETTIEEEGGRGNGGGAGRWTWAEAAGPEGGILHGVGSAAGHVVHCSMQVWAKPPCLVGLPNLSVDRQGPWPSSEGRGGS